MLKSLIFIIAIFVFGAGIAMAQDQPPPAADQPQIAPPPNVSLVDLFYKGGFFMYPLAAASVLSVAIIFERFASLRRRRVIPKKFMEGLRRMLHDRPDDPRAALEFCNKNPSPIARMVAAGLKRMPKGWAAAEKAVEDAGANEALKLRKNMRFLYALGSVSTLLGLIGTISGMIKAFQVAAANGVGKVDQLSTGIYEAMVNTFGGLAVAIVVTIFYYFFVGRIEKLISEINDTLANFSEEFQFNAESTGELAATMTL